ncbi:apolipoprotein N-acyltransferase [bacterium]|nr:apolipoprotein N-acyltransferase [bacterium]
MFRSRMLWSVFAAVISGLLTSLGFPRSLSLHSAFAWLMPIALVPLLLAIERLPTTYQSPARAHSTTLRQVTPFTRGLEAFVLFWIYGATVIAIAFHWVTVPAILFGEIPPAVSNVLFCLYCVLAGLYFPLLFFPLVWNASRCSKRNASPFPTWTLVFTTTAIEILMPRFFHWTYGNLMHGSLPVAQWAAWIGSSGLSVFVFASNIVLSRAFADPVRNPGRVGIALVSTLSTWLVIFAVGHQRLKQLRVEQNQARQTNIGFVQPNFRFPYLPNTKRYPELEKDATLQSLPSLLSLSDELIASQKDSEKLDLLVWPESTTPFDFAWSDADQEVVRKKIKAWNIPLLVQAAEFDKAELDTLGMRKATMYSISFLMRPDGSRSPSFKKWVPMPFGESVPLEDKFPWLGDLVRDNVNNVSKVGRGQSVDALAYSPSDAVAPLICFDAISSDLTRAQATQGNATIYVNQANFLWMWKSNAGFEFLQLGRFRAIENGRSFILAANTGPSAAFTPTGELVGEALPLMTRGALRAKLPVLEKRTIYSDWGDSPLLAGAGLGALVQLIWARRGTRNTGR